jgi:hypothetical protein
MPSPLPDFRGAVEMLGRGLLREAMRVGAKAAAFAADSVLEDVERAGEAVVRSVKAKRSRVAKKRQPLEQRWPDEEEGG